MMSMPSLLPAQNVSLVTNATQQACHDQINQHLSKLRSELKGSRLSPKTNLQPANLLRMLESDIEPTLRLLNLYLKVGESTDSLFWLANKLFGLKSFSLQIINKRNEVKKLKLQLLKQLHHSAVNAKQASLQISDDERIEIYDKLKSESCSIKSLDDLITPIRKDNYKLPTKVATFDRVLAKKQALIKALKPHSSAKPNLKSWRQKPLETAKQLIVFYRFPFILAMNLLAYFLLASPLLQPLTLLSPSLHALTSSILLYGVVLWPVWTATIQRGKTFLAQRLNSSSYKQAVEAISLTDRANNLMVKLQAGILDTPNFAITDMAKEYQAIQSLHDDMTLAMTHQKTSWFGPYALQKQTQATLKALTGPLKHQMGALATHISQRIAQDMPKITRTKANQINLLLPKNKCKEYRKFIEKYGSDQDVEAFNKATTLMPQFELKILAQALSCPNPYALQLPWGQKIPKQADLKGWLTLFEFVGETKGIKLVEVMLGKKTIPAHQFEGLFSLFNKPEQAIKQAHLYLYQCLGQLPLSHVHLLSSQHKAEILAWEIDNREPIKQASTLIGQFLANPARPQDPHQLLEDIPALLGLLEGAKTAYQLKGKAFTLKDDLLKFVETATGANPHAFYAARFFEGDQKDKMIKQLAKLRLQWWVKYPDSVQITFEDQQLFHLAKLSPLWIKQKLKQIKRPGKDLHALLDSLADHGLIANVFRDKNKTHQILKQDLIPSKRRQSYARA